MLPDTIDIDMYLLSIVRTHVVHGVGFTGAFVAATGRTNELHLYTHLVKQVFVEHYFAANTPIVYHAAGVNTDFVCHTGNVITLLCGVVWTVGDDGFAACLKCFEGFSQLFRTAPRKK